MTMSPVAAERNPYANANTSDVSMQSGDDDTVIDFELPDEDMEILG